MSSGLLTVANDQLKLSTESSQPDSGFSDRNGNVSLVSVDGEGDAESLYEDTISTREEEEGDSVCLPESIDDLSYTERILLIQKIIDMFFLNKMTESEALVDPFKDVCINFSHAKMLFSSIASFLTLDPDLMEKAKAEVKRHLDLVYDKRPKRGNFYRYFGREDYNEYTDEEMIAELAYAEATFMYATLTFFHGQSIMTLIKAAFKIHSAHNMINFCHDVLKSKDNWKEEHLRYCFEAGVLNGIGISNLALSNLPQTILKLLALAGLTGDKQLGEDYLKRACLMKNQPRIQMAFCTVLGYNIYFEQMLGFGDGASEWAAETGDQFLQMYPNGAVPLLLAGRVSLLRSDPRRAMQLYQRCLDIHSAWTQIDLFCYFDLIWCHAVTLDWKTAAEYCLILRDKCTWGHAINVHMYACFRYMQNEKDQKEDVKQQICDAMSQVEGLRKRYAGRTYPAEKFSIERAKKFFKQNQSCQVPPAFELFYVWNVFGMLKCDPKLVEPIAERVDQEVRNGNPQRELEDNCVLLLLSGVCAKYLKQYEKAISCLQQVVEHETDSTLNRSYVVPHAMMELGLTYKAISDLKQARHWIEKAQASRSSRYLLEAIVHLKSHGALRQISEEESRIKKRDSQ